MKLIAAIAIDGAIGNDNQLLWDLSEDLKNYKDKTSGNILIVGRKTYETLPHNALLNRTHIVIKHNDGKYIDAPDGSDIQVVHTIKDALKLAKKLKGKSTKEIYIIGGETIYNQTIDLCDEAEITWINKTYPNANKRFQIEKLFEDFDIAEDTGWTKNKNGLIYKIINYKRSE